MANIKSAKKQIKVSERNRVRNQHFKSILKSKVKAALESITEGADKDASKKLMDAAVGTIQHTASKNVINKHNAARRVSRLMLAYQRVYGETPGASGK